MSRFSRNKRHDICVVTYNHVEKTITKYGFLGFSIPSNPENNNL